MRTNKIIIQPFSFRSLNRIIFFVIMTSFMLPVNAQKKNKKDIYSTAYSLNIPEVNINGRRPLKDIGIQQTKIDTTVLHENISLSMADILTQNSTIFIKQYGRGSLATASFRGTSPSHTQVMWNGMSINSPMLGMTDFSMIPSYFIDQATLLHGTSSINITGGGLGGAIDLATKPETKQGLNLQYIQGVSSFNTFDEFLRLNYGHHRWQTSTRAVFSNSPNRYKYKNYNKKENVYNDNNQIISSYYPIERNKNGYFHDFHLLQEIYYNAGKGQKLGLSAWYLHSRRGVPMLNVDYKNDSEYTNEQNENTFRGVLSWQKNTGNLRMNAHLGYIHTTLSYNYSRDLGNGSIISMIHSYSNINTYHSSYHAEYNIGDKWLFTASVTARQHFVKSKDKNIISQTGSKAVVGYDQARLELSGSLSTKWQPTDRLGLSAILREDMYGDNHSPLIPALFGDYVLSKRGHLVAKCSVSRNYHFPTLNDLYFLPGGNPDLKTEKGFSYDGGLSFAIGKDKRFSLTGEATWFDSHIDNWIVWLPSFKGFWTPKNVKKVHAYGIELKGGLKYIFTRNLYLGLNGNFSWTPSINHGDPTDWADNSIGKQLVYIPKRSSSATARVSYKSWLLSYKWCYYSERYTTSSNETSTKIGRLSPYYMSDVTIEKQFKLPWAAMSLKGVINNIFNEEYESVLSRPMPGINYGILLEIRPNW